MMLKALQTGLNILFAAVLLFVFLNLGVAAWAKISPPKPLAFSRLARFPEGLRQHLYPNYSKDEVQALLTESWSIPFVYEEINQFKEKPTTGKYVNVSKYGFRPVANQGPWPPDRKYVNIFVFGGSTTFGYGISDHETIPSYLQQILNGAANADKIRVYNFGRGSYVLGQERALFERLLVQKHTPDIAIFVDGLNDFFSIETEFKFTEHFSHYISSGWLGKFMTAFRELPLMQLIYSRLEEQFLRHKLSKMEDGPSSAREIWLEKVSRYRANKQIIDAVAERWGIQAIFVLQPTFFYEYDIASDAQLNAKIKAQMWDVRIPFSKTAYAALKKAADAGELGKNLLFLGDIHKDIKQPIFVDGSHYSAQFCKMIAFRISREMIARGQLLGAPAAA
jgi:lysophospholipase L1-like esterase